MNKCINRSKKVVGLAMLIGITLNLALFLGVRQLVQGQARETRSIVSPTVHFPAPKVALSTTLTGTLSYTHYFYFPIVANNYAASVWTWLGPQGTDVQTIVCDPVVPGVIFIGTQVGEGVYKSTNGGNSWTVANEGLVYGKVFDLAIDPMTPTIIYAATWGGEGVQKTVNGGDSWQPPQGPLYPGIASLAIDPTNTNIVYAGSLNWEPYGGWIFKSLDGGATWAETSPEFTNALDIVVEWQTGNNIYAGTKLAGIKKSMDGGQSWYSANNGLVSQQVNTIAMDPSDTNVLYAGTKDGVFKSTDSATTWIAVNQGLTNLYVNALAVNPVNTSILYAGTRGGIFKSTNSGASWKAINQGLTNLEVQALVVDPFNPYILYAGTDEGVWRLSSLSGTLWYTGE